MPLPDVWNCKQHYSVHYCYLFCSRVLISFCMTGIIFWRCKLCLNHLLSNIFIVLIICCRSRRSCCTSRCFGSSIVKAPEALSGSKIWVHVMETLKELPYTDLQLSHAIFRDRQLQNCFMPYTAWPAFTAGRISCRIRHSRHERVKGLFCFFFFGVSLHS